MKDITLTDEQTPKVSKILSDYAPKIDAAQKTLKKITDKQGVEIEKLLNADQKAKLAEIRAAAKKKEEPKKEEPKKEEKKPAPDEKK